MERRKRDVNKADDKKLEEEKLLFECDLQTFK